MHVIFVEQASVERVLFVFMSMWFSHACFELLWPRAQKGSLANVMVSLSNIFKTHVVYGEYWTIFVSQKVLQVFEAVFFCKNDKLFVGHYNGFFVIVALHFTLYEVSNFDQSNFNLTVIHKFLWSINISIVLCLLLFRITWLRFFLNIFTYKIKGFVSFTKTTVILINLYI